MNQPTDESVESNDETNRSISITGTNNRYLIKRANRVKNEVKKREIMNKYNISPVFLNYDIQLQLIKEMHNKLSQDINIHEIHEKNLLRQEIERKISSYKQQDLLKNKYNESLFIDLDCILKKIIETDMQCFYCNCQVVVLYEIVRELTQWSVDRINNDEGHNKDNFVIACLNCNIKRRTTNSKKFLFTKQLNLVKLAE
jgi:hypothetical protein